MKSLALLALLFCAALPARAIPLTVDVLGPDDKPIAGAQLSVVEGTYTTPDTPTPRDIAGQNGHFAWDWDGEFPAKDAAFDRTRKYVYAQIAAPGMATQTRALGKAATQIHLGPGRVWGGLVLDADEKPVAGVKVKLARWSVRADDYATFDGDAEAPEQPMFFDFGKTAGRSAVTDAQGRWQLDGLPLQATANLSLSDPRFVSKSYALPIGEGDAPPLFVRPGATITGQIVTPDGKPIADAPVSNGWNGDTAIRTDADGRFTLTGVAPGEVTLRARDYSRWNAEATPDVGYAIPSFDKVRVEAGQTLDIGVWKAQKGLMMRAQIVDADTKKPLEGANISFYGNGTPARADAQGHVETRVTPEDLRNGGTYVGQASADGYVGSSVARPAFGPADETVDLGTLELARGVTLTGTARVEGEDEKTKTALPNMMMSDGNGQSAYIQFWGGNSKFTTQALKPGTYKLTMGYDGQGKSKDWEIVSPQNVTIPAVGGDKPAPIEIVIKRLTPALPLIKEVTGRVVDAQGVGVGGAVITAKMNANNSYGPTTTISANDGSFTLQSGFPATSVEVTDVDRPGYMLSGTPVAQTVDGKTVLTGFSLKRRGAAFKGRVLDANGKGAAGAWVAALEADDYAPVQTAADGTFVMADLPLEKFTLIGAQGFDSAQIATDANAQGVELKLQTQPAPDRAALAERALQGQLNWWNVNGYWDALGTERMAELATRNENNLGQFMAELATRDPQEFLRRAPALLEKLPTDQRAPIEAQMMLARASSGAADDRIAANDWLDTQKTAKRQINGQSVTQLLQMSAVATKLGREDAGDWLDYAAAINAQLGDGGGGDWQGMGRMLGANGYDGITHFVEGAKSQSEFNIWATASVGLAQNGDAAGAKRALARLDELAKAPELVEMGKKQEWNTPVNRIRQAKHGVGKALADTDPASALEMASVPGDEWQQINLLLLVADRASAMGQKEVAARALKTVFGLDSGNVEKFALAASLAQTLDPKLGAEMWRDAYNRAVPAKNNDRGNWRPSIGMWAFYHARLDPAQSRVLIEREWNWRLPAAIKNKDAEYSNDGQLLGQLEMGMAAVDPARALEMREAAQTQATKANQAGSADISLAAAITATDAQRARLGVESGY